MRYKSTAAAKDAIRAIMVRIEKNSEKTRTVYEMSKWVDTLNKVNGDFNIGGNQNDSLELLNDIAEEFKTAERIQKEALEKLGAMSSDSVESTYKTLLNFQMELKNIIGSKTVTKSEESVEEVYDEDYFYDEDGDTEEMHGSEQESDYETQGVEDTKITEQEDPTEWYVEPELVLPTLELDTEDTDEVVEEDLEELTENIISNLDVEIAGESKREDDEFDIEGVIFK